jgi:hypothetical protein
MLIATKENGQMRQSNDGLSRKKEGVSDGNTFTLEEAGISRKLSSKAQKLAISQKGTTPLLRSIKLKASQYILRAERKLGEMLTAAKAAGQITRQHHFAKNDVPKQNNDIFTLDQAGIDRKLSSKAQKLAAIPAKDFEKKIAEGKQSGKLLVWWPAEVAIGQGGGNAVVLPADG